MAASSQQPGQQCPGLNQFSKDNVDDESPEGARDSTHTLHGGHGA